MMLRCHTTGTIVRVCSFKLFHESPDAVDVALWNAEDAGEAWIKTPKADLGSLVPRTSRLGSRVLGFTVVGYRSLGFWGLGF